jgi:hypothetical protein
MCVAGAGQVCNGGGGTTIRGTWGGLVMVWLMVVGESLRDKKGVSLSCSCRLSRVCMCMVHVCYVVPGLFVE